jgi:hypothetical protein
MVDARVGERPDDAGVFIHELRFDLLDLTAADAAYVRALSAIDAQHDAPDDLNRGIINKRLQQLLARRP